MDSQQRPLEEEYDRALAAELRSIKERFRTGAIDAVAYRAEHKRAVTASFQRMFDRFAASSKQLPFLTV